MQKKYIFITIKNKFINEQEVKGIIKKQKSLLIIATLLCISLITITSVSANDSDYSILDDSYIDDLQHDGNEITLKNDDSSSELVDQINNAKMVMRYSFHQERIKSITY